MRGSGKGERERLEGNEGDGLQEGECRWTLIDADERPSLAGF